MTSPTSTADTEMVISVKLSREELYVLMRLLRISSLPGFDPTWLGATPETPLPAATRTALDVATRDLAARNLLQLEGDTALGDSVTAKIPASLIALIGACAYGDGAIWFSGMTPQGPQRAYYHRFRGIYVEHFMPEENIHQFTGIQDAALIIATLGGLMALGRQGAVPVPSGVVASIQLTAARELALSAKLAEAIASLVKGGLPLVTAETLAETMVHATAMGAIARSSLNEQRGTVTHSIAFVVSSTACFLLDDLGNAPNVAVSPLEASMFRQWLTGMFSNI